MDPSYPQECFFPRRARTPSTRVHDAKFTVRTWNFQNVQDLPPALVSIFMEPTKGMPSMLIAACCIADADLYTALASLLQTNDAPAFLILATIKSAVRSLYVRCVLPGRRHNRSACCKHVNSHQKTAASVRLPVIVESLATLASV